MPKRLALAVFAIVVAQLLTALAIVILLLSAPHLVIIPVKVFGTLIVLRSGFFVVYGLVAGDLSSPGWRASRTLDPVKFWSRLTGNIIVVGFGVFLMLLPIR